MDTQNNRKILKCEDLEELAGKRLVVGAKQLRKALQSGRAQVVYLAEDADPAITVPIEEQCQRDFVSCVWVRTMQDLGRACSIDVGAAAAAVVE